MDITKLSKKIPGLILIYIFLFPFGQLDNLVATSFGSKLPVHLVDLTIFLFVIQNLPKISKKVKFLLIALGASWLFSLISIQENAIYPGLFYLIRLIFYILFPFSLLKIITSKNRQVIFYALITSGIVIALVGIIQYFLIPDTRNLKFLGWDDHYFRLIGTFLDPAFTGILLVLTFLSILLSDFLLKTPIIRRGILVFMLVCIALTYSRASFLCLAVSLFSYFLLNAKNKIPIFMILILGVLIIFLPKRSSEGNNLLRTYSVGQKIINYRQSFSLISKNPVFGVGFNNICFFKDKNYSSHSCSGLDNSLLFLLATTGVVGFLALLNVLWAGKDFILKDKLIFTSVIAVLVHSMFTNTLLYPWVMGWMAIVGVAKIKKNTLP